MQRRLFLGLPLAMFAAPPKLPPFSGTVRAFGQDWEVLNPADWAASDNSLDLKVAKPQEANPRAPVQYALAKTPPPQRFTLEVEMKPDVGANGKPGSAIIVYAWRDNLHFNYVHLSPDTGAEQPVHNGIFHVYGGDRVRISTEAGPRAWSQAEWTPVRVVYDAGASTVETWVRGEKNASLRGVDLSLGHGRIGLGSFFNTVSFRNFRLRRA